MRRGHDGSPQEPQWPANPYFGQPWDAPAVDGARQAPTPVGKPCADSVHVSMIRCQSWAK